MRDVLESGLDVKLVKLPMWNANGEFYNFYLDASSRKLCYLVARFWVSVNAICSICSYTLRPEGRRRKRTRREMEEAERQEREAAAAAASLEFERGSSSMSPNQATLLHGRSHATERSMPDVMSSQPLQDVYRADTHRLQPPHWVSGHSSSSCIQCEIRLERHLTGVFKSGLRWDSSATTTASASALTLSD